jgi:uncharacterized protein (TIGR01319 family)
MRSPDALVAEIGSTITKLSAFSGIDTARPAFLGQGIALTSVSEGDVTIGLARAVDDLRERSGVDAGEPGKGAEFLAVSSAAGGLRMTVHGLTRDMTLKAAREASLGAGAVVVYTTAGAITDHDLAAVEANAPRLILLSGGVDYGERDIIVNNARMLASLPDKKVPVIYAGNVATKDEVAAIFGKAGVDLFVTENVYPGIDELNVGPTRSIIQEVFARHIVTAPGMERIKEMAGGPVIPTPGAVLMAAEILYGRIGDLAAVDVGGATTDVHSVTEGSEKFAAMSVSPEPLSKRTVEGDLGVYINARHVIEQSRGAIPDMDDTADTADVTPLPRTDSERERVGTLTRWAVDLSIWRHAGAVKVTYGAYGKSEIVEGRDLTKVSTLIGTGGALTRLPGGAAILGAIRRDPHRRKLLPPAEVKVCIDADYIMASAGVLGKRYPDAAASLLMTSLGLN